MLWVHGKNTVSSARVSRQIGHSRSNGWEDSERSKAYALSSPNPTRRSESVSVIVDINTLHFTIRSFTFHHNVRSEDFEMSGRSHFHDMHDVVLKLGRSVKTKEV